MLRWTYLKEPPSNVSDPGADGGEIRPRAYRIRIGQQLQVDVAAVVEAVGAAQPPVSLTENEEEGGGQFDIPVASP